MDSMGKMKTSNSRVRLIVAAIACGAFLETGKRPIGQLRAITLVVFLAGLAAIVPDDLPAAGDREVFVFESTSGLRQLTSNVLAVDLEGIEFHSGGWLALEEPSRVRAVEIATGRVVDPAVECGRVFSTSLLAFFRLST